MYSRWSNSFFYTNALTGAPHILAAKLFINPKVGDSYTVKYEVVHLLDANWAAQTFPYAPMYSLPELLKTLNTFKYDMEHNVYRYKGFKYPV